MNSRSEKIYRVAKLLIHRLERLSADSIWARSASGRRGALLRGFSTFQDDPNNGNIEKMEILVSEGFKMLAKAASEIPDIEAILKEYE